MTLVPKALALTLGITWGAILFLATNLSILRGGTGQFLSLFSIVYPGYSFSFLGSIIGLVWGFVAMFILGWVIAWLYNKFATPSAPKA